MKRLSKSITRLYRQSFAYVFAIMDLYVFDGGNYLILCRRIHCVATHFSPLRIGVLPCNVRSFKR